MSNLRHYLQIPKAVFSSISILGGKLPVERWCVISLLVALCWGIGLQTASGFSVEASDRAPRSTLTTDRSPQPQRSPLSSHGIKSSGTLTFEKTGAGLNEVGDGSSSIADVNGDGNEDLLITGYDGNGYSSTLYLGDGEGGFSEAEANLTGVSIGSSSIADVNGDGNRDLLITGYDNSSSGFSATLYLGDGEGGFSEAEANLTGVGNSSSSVADVDGDEKKDLLITGYDAFSNETTTLYRNQNSASATYAVAGVRPESGTPETRVQIYGTDFASKEATTVAFGEVEALVDSVSTDSTVIYARVPSGPSGPVEVSVKQEDASVEANDKFVVVTGGDGDFPTRNVIDGKAYLPFHARSFDLDGDGDFDIVYNENSQTRDTVSWSKNSKSKGLLDPKKVYVECCDDSGTYGDIESLNITGNKNKEILLSTKSEIRFVRKTSNGFENGLISSTQNDPRGIDVGDVDKDGKKEIISGGKNTVYLYDIYDGGGFSESKLFEGSSVYYTVSLSNVEGSSLDVLFGSREGSGGDAKIISLLNNEDGSFNINVIDSDVGGSTVQSIESRDLNKDGKEDIIVGATTNDGNGKLVWYENMGRGEFSQQKVIATNGREAFSIHVSDIDADGDQDLLAAIVSKVLWFENDGNGNFSEPVTIASNGRGWRDVSTPDLNGDGVLDVLLVREAVGGEVSWLTSGKEQGESGLAISSVVPNAGVNGAQVRIRGSDFGTDPSAVSVFFDSTTTAIIDSVRSNAIYARVPSGLPPGPVSVQVESGGETAASGQRFTVLTPERGGGPIDRIGPGDTQIPGLKRSGSDWADYDRDGDLDLVVTGEDADGNPVTRVYKNGPVDPFANDQFVALGAGLADLKNGAASWGDYNNDGHPDLAVGGTDGSSPSTLVYRNDGEGTFTEIAGPDSTGLATGDLAWGDLDGDGDLDLVASGLDQIDADGQPTTIVYENKGDTDDDGEVEFDAAETGLTGLSFSSLDLGDINGDGNLDLVISGSADGAGAVNPSLETIVYENQGTGNLDFQPLGLGLNALQLGSAEWGDYNQDGRLDLLLAGRDGSNSPQTLIYENQGDTDGDGSPNFQSLGAGLTGVESGQGTWGDYDGDGDLDVALSGRAGDGSLTTEIYQNDGSGTFSRVESGLDGTEGSVTWADYDRDGDLDILSLGRDASESPAAVLYDNGLPAAPPGVSAELRQVENEEDFPGDDSVAVGVLWDYPDELNTESYNIYRDTEPIPRREGPSGLEPSGTESTNRLELYLDPEPSPGQTYYYRVTAVDQNGRESGFSEQARFFWYPEVVSTDAERTFGSGRETSDYRLIALPGRSPDPEVRPRTLPEVLPDDASWRAFWDDGSAPQDYTEYDESDTFNLRPGRGFWVLSTETWTGGGSIWETVDLRGDSVAVVDLHDGWNIVSNPTGKDIGWNEVLETNDLEPKGLFSFNGTYSEEDVMASAQSGEAYYFLNDAGLEELLLPYPGAPGQSSEKSANKSREQESRPSLVLQARTDSMISKAKVQFSETAEEGYGDGDVVAPASRFSALGLRLESPAADPGPRRGYLSTERRPQVGSGQTFDLELWTRGKRPVEMEVQGTQSLSGREVSLIVPAQEESYDLRKEESFVVKTGQDTTRMRLVVGSSSYVEEQRGEVVPEELTLEAYPNPARQRATLRYGLPKEGPVEITVYDVLGRRVAQVTDGQRQPAGRHRAEIGANQLPSGMYFIRMRAGGETKTRKLTVVN